MTVIRFETGFLFFLSILISLIWCLAYKNKASGNSFNELSNESVCFFILISKKKEREERKYIKKIVTVCCTSNEGSTSKETSFPD